MAQSIKTTAKSTKVPTDKEFLEGKFQLMPENESTDDAETTLSGSAFQILAVAATAMAKLPTVDSSKDSTCSANNSSSFFTFL